MKNAVSVNVVKGNISNLKDGSVLVGFFKDKVSLDSDLKKLDAEVGGTITSYLKNNGFKAEKGEMKSIFVNKNIKNIFILGLGDEKKFGLDVLSFAIADAAKRIRDSGFENFYIHLDSIAQNLNTEDAVKQVVLSSIMGLYKFTEYKTKDKDKIKYVKQITILTSSNNSFEQELKYAATVADAVVKTKDLVNTPPNVATPEYIANYAQQLAKNSGLKCTVYDEKQIISMKMDCFMAVAKGSINRPKLVVLEYNGAGKDKKPIAVVGKGITFDTGGINVKPYPFILNMKDDKGGAVAGMHVIEACAKLKLKINLIVVMPFCENMIDAASFRPDDVYKASNGITVEIKNTDAEGRLILADALHYAVQKKPESIISIATLTGATFVVLGYTGAPYVCTDEKLRRSLNSASSRSLEKLWELPLWPEYEDSLRSEVADFKHIGDEGEAGVLTAATFLKNFVSDVPWAHIDIGTVVWSKVDKGVLTKGATGSTVRLMIEMLREWK